jgi:hypothetical protein
MRMGGEEHEGAETCDDKAHATSAAITWRRPDMAVDLATFLLLLWPLALNGAPFYSEDSASYLRGGGVGFDTGLLMLSQAWESIVGSAPAADKASASAQAIAQAAVADSGGVRSLIYSLLAYILRAPGSSLVALAVAQAAAVTVIVSCLRRLVLPGIGVWLGLATGAAVAFLTSAAWYAAYAMPDVIAGVTIGGALVLTVFFDRLYWPTRILLVLLVSFGVTVHGSHLPVALATLAAGAAAHVWLRRSSLHGIVAPLAWFASPLVLGIAALLATSYAAFGEPSVSPKRYPILLARSVEDGPAAWHLRDHCATERYAICEVFGPYPPRDAGAFLWAADGVRALASPEQMERIRGEEAKIIRRAAFEYPLEQLGASAGNMARQFVLLGLTGLPFGHRLVGIDDPVIERPYPDRPMLKTLFEIVIYATFFGNLALLALARHALRQEELAAVGVAFTGLVANAAVCGILSGVTDRYQGRAAWVLAALTILVVVRIALERRRTKGRWRPTRT